jgi:hypothetical protein
MIPFRKILTGMCWRRLASLFESLAHSPSYQRLLSLSRRFFPGAAAIAS